MLIFIFIFLQAMNIASRLLDSWRTVKKPILILKATNDSRYSISTAPILTDCEYGLGTPLSWRRKVYFNDCANPNKGTHDLFWQI